MVGEWGRTQDFYGKRVLAILKTCSTRLELRNYSRTYRNSAILSFDFIICQSEQFDFYPFNTNDHRYPYLNSIYK